MSIENDIWPDMDDASEEPEKPIEEEIREILQEQWDQKPRKINNVKRPRPAHQPAPTRTSMACSHCGPAVLLVDDERSGTCVCPTCGMVARHMAPRTIDVPGTVAVRPVVSARLNYLKERLSQWSRTEPTIPRSARESLIAAFRRLTDVGRQVRVSYSLTKYEVRAVVIEAGLPPKNLVEKWLTIRALLRKTVGLEDDCPMPSEALKTDIVRLFKQLLRVWQERPELRHGRESLPNLNFVICMLILMISVEEYRLHYQWFPPVTEQKRAVLMTIWAHWCRLLEWPLYIPVVDAQGVVHRQLQPQITGSERKRSRRSSPGPARVEPCSQIHQVCDSE